MSRCPVPVGLRCGGRGEEVAQGRLMGIDIMRIPPAKISSLPSPSKIALCHPPITARCTVDRGYIAVIRSLMAPGTAVARGRNGCVVFVQQAAFLTCTRTHRYLLSAVDSPNRLTGAVKELPCHPKFHRMSARELSLQSLRQSSTSGPSRALASSAGIDGTRRRFSWSRRRVRGEVPSWLRVRLRVSAILARNRGETRGERVDQAILLFLA